jgi:membrane-bound lytic murein transglycosylase A
MAMSVRAALLFCFAGGLAACASNPAPVASTGKIPTQPSVAKPPPPPDLVLTAAAFADLPNWASTDMTPALAAFRRQCNAWSARAADTPVGGRYGGTVMQWQPACTAAAGIQPGNEHWFFETYFEPQLVSGAGEARLTSYYEPIIEARRTPEATFTEPLLRTPGDLITVDIAAFAKAYDNDALRGAPRALNGKLTGNRIEPYPKRDEIQPAPGQVIAYAHPADVYNLQVQGSGRLRFADGTQARAQFSAQNGYKWNSALAALGRSGQLAAPSWKNFRGWLDSNPGGQRTALNADPSYVFFQEEPIADAAAGPRGAAGVPLTPQGSIAVDPAYHPYGALVFVDGAYSGYAFNRLLVAQDTGGAIRRGPMRGDVFWGSGPEAGAAAEKINGPARWWTLVPRSFSSGAVASVAATSATP